MTGVDKSIQTTTGRTWRETNQPKLNKETHEPNKKTTSQGEREEQQGFCGKEKTHVHNAEPGK